MALQPDRIPLAGPTNTNEKPRNFPGTWRLIVPNLLVSTQRPTLRCFVLGRSNLVDELAVIAEQKQSGRVFIQAADGF